MKLFKMTVVAVLTMLGAAAFAQTKTDKIKVLGNCGMCKNRIEKGLKKDSAITSAEWDKTTKFLTVAYDKKKLDENAIHQKIAALGHDTDKAKATDEVYAKLPGCCKYDRTGKTVKSH
ncbi:heavy-metal-associated domain-containing protein [Pedobacter sp. UBA4863]|uniref:heavy-metal-associated domain-containing protein n=1 Tax=Pedobacter sp. UBA4863 TaxID=1947060 RepID=UPI0025F342FD|nr:heavy-metal-associated domain-containing protein [Pedobacter sp. UBA4863]